MLTLEVEVEKTDGGVGGIFTTVIKKNGDKNRWKLQEKRKVKETIRSQKDFCKKCILTSYGRGHFDTDLSCL